MWQQSQHLSTCSAPRSSSSNTEVVVDPHGSYPGAWCLRSHPLMMLSPGSPANLSLAQRTWSQERYLPPRPFPLSLLPSLSSSSLSSLSLSLYCSKKRSFSIRLSTSPFLFFSNSLSSSLSIFPSLILPLSTASPSIFTPLY